jgi:hypothetical protein
MPQAPLMHNILRLILAKSNIIYQQQIVEYNEKLAA